MNYELAIHPEAEKEWAKPDGSIKRRFKEKLAKEHLKHPYIAKDALRELPDCYKIKITAPQFRVICHVNDTKKLLTIISVATRDDVYADYAHVWDSLLERDRPAMPEFLYNQSWSDGLCAGSIESDPEVSPKAA